MCCSLFKSTLIPTGGNLIKRSWFPSLWVLSALLESNSESNSEERFFSYGPKVRRLSPTRGLPPAPIFARRRSPPIGKQISRSSDPADFWTYEKSPGGRRRRFRVVFWETINIVLQFKEHQLYLEFIVVQLILMDGSDLMDFHFHSLPALMESTSQF